MIKLIVPEHCTEEINYVVKIIFSRFWNLEYSIENSTNCNFQIDLGKGSIWLPDIFFKKYNHDGINISVLPELPLKEMQLSAIQYFDNSEFRKIPVLYGLKKNPGDYIVTNGSSIHIDIDIFGSIFFLLTRYEEYLVSKNDKHSRFPVSESLAFKAGFLDRPLVNEYLEILWEFINILSPGLSRRKQEFSMEPSHDVDVPFFSYGRSRYRVFRETISEMVVRRRLNVLPELLIGILQTKYAGYEKDPYFTFRYIMDQSEERNIKSTFYFITDNSAGEIDCSYNIDDAEIKKLIKEIASRGHNIGLHASYNSYLDKNKLLSEQSRLSKISEELGIEQKSHGVRQHYLRFSVPDTFKNQESAGITYDSTLGFAEKPGFRCGICYEYPVFDLVQKRQMSIIEKPLVVMECSLILPRYAGLRKSESVAEDIIKYKNTCRKYNGRFTLLWHNNHLAYDKERSWYESILDA